MFLKIIRSIRRVLRNRIRNIASLSKKLRIEYLHRKSLGAIRKKIESLPEFNAPDDIIGKSRPLEIVFWPEYPNPYQILFYGSSSKNYRTYAGDVDNALDSLQKSRATKTVVFNLHWLNTLVSKNGPREDVEEAVEGFLLKIERFQRGGGIFVWTIHNVVSHDTPYADIEISLSERLTQIADVLIIHGESARGEIEKAYPLPREKVIVVNHGSYVGIYRDRISQIEARKKLNISKDGSVFLFFGLIRAYKGIEELIEEFSALRQRSKPAQLLIAGRPLDLRAATLHELTRGKVRLTTSLRHIADDEIEVYMRAANWVVLPYRRVLTSGSALLAMSFGKPVIAPRLGLLSELIEDGSDGLLYDPGAEHGLRMALAKAISMSSEDVERMSHKSLQKARGLGWSAGRKAFVRQVIKAALGKEQGDI